MPNLQLGDLIYLHEHGDRYTYQIVDVVNGTYPAWDSDYLRGDLSLQTSWINNTFWMFYGDLTEINGIPVAGRAQLIIPHARFSGVDGITVNVRSDGQNLVVDGGPTVPLEDGTVVDYYPPNSGGVADTYLISDWIPDGTPRIQFTATGRIGYFIGHS